MAKTRVTVVERMIRMRYLTVFLPAHAAPVAERELSAAIK
jgi:hypothetical protein